MSDYTDAEMITAGRAAFAALEKTSRGLLMAGVEQAGGIELAIQANLNALACLLVRTAAYGLAPGCDLRRELFDEIDKALNADRAAIAAIRARAQEDDARLRPPAPRTGAPVDDLKTSVSPAVIAKAFE